MTAKEREIKRIEGNHYRNVHAWLRNNYGKANRCQALDCNDKNKIFEWSLIKGKTYCKDRNNFWMLCKSCHAKYDSTIEGRKAGSIKIGIKTKKRFKVRGAKLRHSIILKKYWKNKVHHASQKGETQWNHKLTDIQVIEIKKLINNKIGTNTIAHIYKINPSTICDIKKGRTWKHIT